MGRTFSNCGYTVTVNDDRSILVRPGDWISKYAAAIYGSPNVNWDKFKKKENGQYGRLSNPHMIVVGHRVYHPDPLPGEPGFGVGQPAWDIVPAWNPLDRETFLRRLHDEGGVRGERLDRMSSLLTGTKWRDISEANALEQLGYLSLETFKGWGMLNGSMLLPQALSGVPGFIAVFQMTFQSMVALLDAQESALRFQGLRAIAYATTAFAFGDPLPCLPYGIEYNLTHGEWRGVVPLNQYRVNWLDVAGKATTRLAADLSTRGVNKQVYQTWIRWEANDRRELALRFMEEFARGMSTMLPADRVMLMSPKPIYPNDC